jgi:hypothetical protein
MVQINLARGLTAGFVGFALNVLLNYVTGGRLNGLVVFLIILVPTLLITGLIARLYRRQELPATNQRPIEPVRRS